MAGREKRNDEGRFFRTMSDDERADAYVRGLDFAERTVARPAYLHGLADGVASRGVPDDREAAAFDAACADHFGVDYDPKDADVKAGPQVLRGGRGPCLRPRRCPCFPTRRAEWRQRMSRTLMDRVEVGAIYTDGVELWEVVKECKLGGFDLVNVKTEAPRFMGIDAFRRQLWLVRLPDERKD